VAGREVLSLYTAHSNPPRLGRKKEITHVTLPQVTASPNIYFLWGLVQFERESRKMNIEDGYTDTQKKPD